MPQALSAAPTVRRDLIGAGAGVVLVAVAFALPLVASEEWRGTLVAHTAPIFGFWEPHLGWGSGPALAIAVLVIGFGPRIAAQASWRVLCAATYLGALGWAVALALIDGWERGFARRLTDSNEYLAEVDGVKDIPAMLRGFSDRILDFRPDSWTTHVSGHPPGALLSFVWVDRIGLSGGAWAGTFCVVVGCSASVAVLVAVRALGSEALARSCAPFLVLAPAAVWIAVSADAMFAGVTAWAIALLAVAATRQGRRAAWIAAAAGIGFGFGIYLNYGMVLMGVPAVFVLVATRNVRPLLPALGGALVVAAIFTASGFWWLDGYHLVVERYYQGIASLRPYSYWVWGNLAAVVCATGLAVPAALHRLPANRFGGNGVPMLVAGMLCAIVLADLSGLSKAETERIWLPFTIWLFAACALLPERHARRWLVVQAAGTLVLVHLIFTNW